jgi:rhomboid family GlyGly-CTERM serine protease
VTGHWLHLDWTHLLYNSLGLTVYWVLWGRELSRHQFALLWLAGPPLVGLGLLAFAPEVAIYVGLSGVLHGAFAHAAVLRLRAGGRDGVVLLALLAAKVLWEQSGGGPLAAPASPGSIVVVAAHLYGLVAGAALALGRRPDPASRVSARITR